MLAFYIRNKSSDASYLSIISLFSLGILEITLFNIHAALVAQIHALITFYANSLLLADRLLLLVNHFKFLRLFGY